MSKSYFFIGIGGSGMSAIAQALAHRGHSVAGSDRSLDQGKDIPIFHQLRKMNISLHMQDGSGITPDMDFVVVSTAIEKTVPDMAKAMELNIPVLHRSDLLAEIFNDGRGVAAGGTSGKSTVTGMVGYVLDSASMDPCIINGGKMKNYTDEDSPGNARVGLSDFVVIESDESDGSIVKYKPEVAIVTNVTRDHKPIEELKELFRIFVENTSGTAVLNADCPISSSLAKFARKSVTFGIKNPADVKAENCAPGSLHSTFEVGGLQFKINLPGTHNISNALATIAAARCLGIADEQIAKGLGGFSGICRRFDVRGEAAGVTVIDDFGHNPDKIRATLATLHLDAGRKLVMFQPHGFGPTKFMMDELIEVFSADLGEEDILYMPEIFYAGGTADKSISSEDIIKAIAANGRNAEFYQTRDEAARAMSAIAKPGDVIAVLGARDDTLPAFCDSILALLKTSNR